MQTVEEVENLRPLLVGKYIRVREPILEGIVVIKGD